MYTFEKTHSAPLHELYRDQPTEKENKVHMQAECMRIKISWHSWIFDFSSLQNLGCISAPRFREPPLNPDNKYLCDLSCFYAIFLLVTKPVVTNCRNYTDSMDDGDFGCQELILKKI